MNRYDMYGRGAFRETSLVNLLVLSLLFKSIMNE